MSDLISRSALLQKFNDTGIQITFDLPVEEILSEDVDIDDFTMLVQDAIQAYKNMVIGTINDMPTAYNVDNVVAEIADLNHFNIQLADKMLDIQKSGKTRRHYICAEDAIDIVRKDGVE